MINKITLSPFEVKIARNGYWYGLCLTKDLTLSEALYVADRALGINTDIIISDWQSREDLELDEIEIEKEEFIFDIQSLISGDFTWDAFTNKWTCDEGLEDIYPVMFIQLLYICQEQGFIK